MWLAYKGERYAYNLTSAVENLGQHFENLEFDALHESQYFFERFYTYDQCNELARKYEKAVEACNIFLHTSDLRTFLQTMKVMEFEKSLDEVKKFAPSEIFQEIFGDTEI